MKITYDAKADALYIKLSDGGFVENQEIEDGLVLDLGYEKSLLGIELLDVSRKVPKESLSHVDVEISPVLTELVAV